MISSRWLAVTLLAAALAGGGLLIRWLRARPWRGPRTRHPVVLAHGVMGFEKIGLGPLRQDYFRGVVSHLRSLGVEVYCPRVPAARSVAERAEALASYIRALPARRVNIIAHSMGGLDARYAISKLGLAPRVASLVTIGTPHRGTRVADAGTALVGETLRLRRLLATGVASGFLDLTTERMRAFNREVRNAWRVRYACVVGAIADGSACQPRLLEPTHAYLRRNEGPNDGLVPAWSQRWGKLLCRVDASHWAQIGWGGGFDAPAFYERLANRLRGMRL